MIELHVAQACQANTADRCTDKVKCTQVRYRFEVGKSCVCNTGFRKAELLQVREMFEVGEVRVTDRCPREIENGYVILLILYDACPQLFEARYGATAA